MANKATGIKSRRNKSWKGQDTSGVYGANKRGSSNRGKNYNTGDNTLKKTKGIDDLQGETKEKRGRTKSNAPRGKKKGTGKGHN